MGLMTSEEQELLNSFQEELEGAFTGSPSLRIKRQLYALGILND